LCNAALVAGCAPADLVAAADSTTLCLSKGLGAPVGSLLAGSQEFVAAARRVRKAFGGGMRQAGVIAAAGLIALHEGPKLLAADHRRARALAAIFADQPFAAVDVAAVETNIVMVDLAAADPDALLAALAAHSVLAAKAGPRRIRFVTHRDVDDASVDATRAAVAAFARTLSR
jgi:threonine aldolase